MPGHVRQLIVTLWPHESDTTVTVVVRDTSGRARWDRGAGDFRLPIGRVEVTGLPLSDVLGLLGEALAQRADSQPAKRAPEPPGGLQGGLKTSPEYEALTLL